MLMHATVIKDACLIESKHPQDPHAPARTTEQPQINGTLHLACFLPWGMQTRATNAMSGSETIASPDFAMYALYIRNQQACQDWVKNRVERSPKPPMCLLIEILLQTLKHIF
jgi:hypothetical protein